MRVNPPFFFVDRTSSNLPVWHGATDLSILSCVQCGLEAWGEFGVNGFVQAHAIAIASRSLPAGVVRIYGCLRFRRSVRGSCVR